MSRTGKDYRGYAGQVASGRLRPGDEVVILPSGMTTTITSIDTFEGPLEEARPHQAAALRLEDDIDVARGDMICRPHNRPTAIRDIDAMITWMYSGSDLVPGRVYRLKHTTRTVRAVVKDVLYRLDISTMHRDLNADTLTLNEVGRVDLGAMSSIFADDYHRNRTTGGFILIDEATNQTVAGGMIRLPSG